ncbi:MAG TPA: kelch-like protein [Candidatus Bathyarchaeota archaeon]|nr:kelch-like protein [Candidatus Bathyarchaeota archaeon]
MKNRALALAFISALLFSLTVAITSASEADNSWVTKKSMNSARTGAGAAAVNEIIYAIGGSQRHFGSDTEFFYVTINSTEAYNPAADTWTEKASMPTSRGDFGTAVYQNKIYCIGGKTLWKIDVNVTNVNEVYDTERDSWETKTPMPTGSYGIEANVVDGKIYLIGGWIQSESSSNIEKSDRVDIYDPVTDTWDTGSPIPMAVAGYASAVMDGKIYVISGVASGSTITNLTQIYDPKTDKWSSGMPIPMGVGNGAAGATTGTKAAKAIYVIGGSNATYPLSGQYMNQVYFPETNSWSVAASMPVDRAGLSVTVVNDTLYAIGGGHNIFTMDSAVVMLYTPFTSSSAGIEHSPIVPVVIAVLFFVAVVVMGAGLLYRKKHKKIQQTTN